MTHLTKPKVVVDNDFTEFYGLFTLEQTKDIEIKFQNGYLISIDTTNPDMIAFAKSHGLS